MELSKNTWHYRNFQAWQRRTKSNRHADLRVHWEEHYNTDRHRFVREEVFPTRQPDLCTYTRIALLYGPVHRIGEWFSRHPNVGATALVTFFAAWTLGILSIVAFAILGEGHSWWVYVLGAFGIAAGIAAVIGTFYGARAYYLYRKDMVRSGQVQPNIVTERIKAHKSKVCPMIEFKEDA